MRQSRNHGRTVRALVARHYDPTTGTFISRDPLEDVTGAPYSYVGDDPLDQIDPSGLCWPSWACGVENTVVTGGKGAAGVIAGAATYAKDSVFPPILIHPIRTVKGLINGCRAGYNQYSGGGASGVGYGVLGCIDQINPYANIRR